MKTEKLSFEEAVKAIKEGKCKNIKSLETNTLYFFNNPNNKVFTAHNGFDSPTVDEIFGEWDLVGVKKWKKVYRNVRWARTAAHGTAYPYFNDELVSIEELVNMGKLKMTLEREEDQEE